jgi:hypothetical protein
VLWYLQTCLRLLDKLGYDVAAANVSAAIDALETEALSEEDLAEVDFEREERVRLLLELYEKHKSIDPGEGDSTNPG